MMLWMKSVGERVEISRERLNVQNEDDWCKNRPLRDTKLENSWKGFRTTDGNCLDVVGKVGTEPEENKTGETKRSVET